MNKTWLFIGVTAMVMIGVMVFLTIKGVSHREHTFIKWSSVEKADEIGLASMRRLFPLLKPLEMVTLNGPDAVIAGFKNGFLYGLAEQKIDLPLDSSEETAPSASNLVVEFISLDMDRSPGSCSDVSKRQCLYYKAQRGWLKKDRKPSRFWFLLQWIENNHFLLFYTEPTGP